MNKPTKEQIEYAKHVLGHYAENDVQSTVLFALRFTEKMLGEPSEGMKQAGDEICYVAGARSQFVCETEVFKAMLAEAIKEIEE